MPEPPCEPVRQFTQVAMLGVAPVLIMADPNVGPATLAELPKAGAAPGCAFGSGVSGPDGLPPEIVERLSATLATRLADPGIVKRCHDLGITPVKMTTAESGRCVARQVTDRGPAIWAADIEP